MKNQKGISLITLLFTILLMLIITTITMYSGFEAYDNMKVQAYVAKLKTLQEKVDVFCDKYSVREINTMGTEYSQSPETAKRTLDEVIEDSKTTGLNSWTEVDAMTPNYRYFSAEAIESYIGVKDFDMAIWLNPLTRNIIAVDGVTVDDHTYYRQYDLPGGQTLEQPVFNTDTQLKATVKTYDNKAEITLDKKYAKITCYLKDEVTSKESSKVYTHTDTILLTESGNYRLVATDYDRNVSDYSEYADEIKDQYAGLEKTAELSVAIVNKPLLVEGMTAIDETGKKITSDEEKQTWYNYSEKKWANVELIDGSQYVWIPRFAYKITDGKIDVKFLKEFSNITTEGKALDNDYKVAPAFQDGTALLPSSFANGEWDSEITGFWVAKYEVINVNGFACANGAETTQSDKDTPISAFSKCRNLEKNTGAFGTTVTINVSGELGINGEFPSDTNNIDSHLMKNSEYGAIAYLTRSIYGAGETKIKAQSGYYPGQVSDENSTTQNKTGIYGLSGGSPEIVAAGVNIDGVFNSSNNSTKYATVYHTAGTIYGDAMLPSETSAIGYGGGFSHITSEQIFTRGGNLSGGNISEFTSTDKTNNSNSYRPVLIIEY